MPANLDSWLVIAAGLFLVAYSIIFGVETAQGFKWTLRKLSTSSQPGHFRSRSSLKADSSKIPVVVTVVLLVVVVLFYCLSGSLEWKEINKGGSRAQLLLACMVGPLGVWTRWFLAKKLNGQGLGKNGFLKWLPFGTLTANVFAACVMALFAILKKAVRLSSWTQFSTFSWFFTYHLFLRLLLLSDQFSRNLKVLGGGLIITILYSNNFKRTRF